MSFIDLMGNVVWSDADITNRTESLVRAEFSVQDELILNRKMQGVAAGIYTLTPEEAAQVQRFQQICFVAQQEGAAARQDMALLINVFFYEAAARRLDRDAVAEGEEGYEEDLAERVEAQSVIDSAPQEVVDLAALRNPPVEEDAGEPQ